MAPSADHAAQALPCLSHGERATAAGLDGRVRVRVAHGVLAERCSARGGSGDGHAQLRKKIPRSRRNAHRRRPVRLLGRPVLRRLLRRHHDVLRLPRHRADRLWRGAGPDLEHLADQHRAARPELRPGVRAAAGGRPLADHHGLRARRLRLLGAARGRDLPQARHGLSRARSPSASRSSPISPWS